MKKFITIASFVIMSSSMVAAQDGQIFPKGELAKTTTHTGDVWLKSLNAADSVIDIGIATATFAPGARLDWHIHPAGQILLVTDGVGFYQERGKAKLLVHKGDVIKCLPGVPHWHGASVDSMFSYLAVGTNTAKGGTVWLERVTDEEYKSLK